MTDLIVVRCLRRLTASSSATCGDAPALPNARRTAAPLCGLAPGRRDPPWPSSPRCRRQAAAEPAVRRARHVCGTRDWPQARALEAQPTIRAVMLPAAPRPTSRPAVPCCCRSWRTWSSRWPCSRSARPPACACCPTVTATSMATTASRRPRPRRRCSHARASAARHCPTPCPAWPGAPASTCRPLDLRDPAQCDWLETLVWPEHSGRLQRLRAAMRIAQADPPPVHRGDLLTDLPALARHGAGRCDARGVPHRGAGLYRRPRRARPVRRRRCAASTRCGSATKRPAYFPPSRRACAAADRKALFCWRLTATPVAWTQPHGGWIDWLEPGDVSA